MEQKNISIDFLKGIGIISVVMGHCCHWSVQYVYMYHLAMFFYTAGYVYNEKKYAKNVPMLFASRMHSIMPMYLVYSTLFVVFRNSFINMGILSGNMFTAGEILNQSVSSIIFITELFGSAFWFIPELIVGTVLFGAVVSFSKRFSPQAEWKVIFAGCWALGGIGCFMVMDSISVIYRLEVALLIVPIIWFGYVIRKLRNSSIFESVKKYGIITAAMGLACIIFVPKITGTHFELSIMQIINPFVFYSCSFFAMLFWHFVADELNSEKKMYSLIAYIGRNSIHIMALHLCVIKLVDYIYLRFVVGQTENMAAFPYSVQKLWPVYIVTGVFIPLAVPFLYNKLRHKKGK